MLYNLTRGRNKHVPFKALLTHTLLCKDVITLIIIYRGEIKSRLARKMFRGFHNLFHTFFHLQRQKKANKIEIKLTCETNVDIYERYYMKSEHMPLYSYQLVSFLKALARQTWPTLPMEVI